MCAGVANFQDRVGANRRNAETPFGHGLNILETDKIDITQFAHLIQRDIKLANIAGDGMIRNYQTEGFILVNAFSMSKRDKVMKPVFSNMYWNLIFELGITRSKDGGERDYQARVGGGYGERELSGYGSDFAQQQQDSMETNQGLISGVKNAVKNRFKR